MINKNRITNKPAALRRDFAFLSLLTIIIISAICGHLLLRFLSQHLLERDLRVSAEFIQSAARINNPEPYFYGSDIPDNRGQLEEFFHHITLLPDVLRATVYDKNETIIWSNQKELIGQRFNGNDELQRAFNGELLFKRAVASHPAKTEHLSFSIEVTDFVESYIPIWDDQHRSVIGVVELYKAPDVLFAALTKGRWLVMSISAAGAIVLYLILFGIVHRAAGTIEQQSVELQERIRQLSQLLAQNHELRQRVQHANRRTIELNEQVLRRVGAELHDGPAQWLSFALLRLEFVQQGTEKCNCSNLATTTAKNEVNTIRQALTEAMQEIRRISAGLAVPQLSELTMTKTLQRVVRVHCQRSQSKVDLQLDQIPEQLPQPLKICAYRAIQEGLNNASRYAQGQQQRVEVHGDDTTLRIAIIDNGPGFNPDETIDRKDNEKLGLSELRERIHSLEGDFCIESAPGCGTRLNITLPLDEQQTLFA